MRFQSETSVFKSIRLSVDGNLVSVPISSLHLKFVIPFQLTGVIIIIISLPSLLNSFKN